MSTLALDYTPASGGLTPRPYQEDAIRAVIDKEAAGVKRQLGVAATGLGKAQPVDEPVLTPWGWRAIGSLSEGDEVIGSNGKAVKVVGVYPQGPRPTYRVKFTDQTSVRCDVEHIWSVRTKSDKFRNRPWRCMTVRELLASDLHNQEGWRWFVPLVAPVEFPEAQLPLDPYLLGILLGDGGLSTKGRVSLSSEDELVATLTWPVNHQSVVQIACGSGGIASTYLITGRKGCSENEVLSAIRDLGLAGHKSTTKWIPDRYKLGSVKQRLDLLRGLLDADGHVTKDNHVEATWANKWLAYDVADLVRSLGGTARVKKKRTTWTYKGANKHGRAWRLSIAMNICPFRWEKKASVWRPRVKYFPSRAINSIEPLDIRESVCIAVDSEDQLYVTHDYVLTHNTIIFTELARRLNRRTLILAHRDELIRQAADKLRLMWPEVQLGIVKAERNEIDAPVVLASVQTISRPSRLAKIFDQFDLVIVDEAHHCAADSYKRVLDHFGCFKPGGPLLVGVTATPDRGDRIALDHIFQEIVFSYDMRWGIKEGYLSDISAKEVMLQLDLDKVKTARGDWMDGALSDALIEANAPEHIVDAWQEHASNRKTLVFTPTVALAQMVSDEFRSRGINSNWASANTESEDRQQLLVDFASEKLQVLSNCALFTEGFDEPSIECILMARPTKSRSFYAQMIGRGTRKFPGKTDCLILDVVGVARRHSLATTASLLGLDPSKMKKGMSAAQGIYIQDNPPPPAPPKGKLHVEDINIWETMKEAEFAWVRTTRGYALSMADRILSLQQHAAGWGVVVQRRGQADTILSVTKPGLPLEVAQGVAEDYARKNNVAALINREAEWRKLPASPKQIEALKKWRIPIPRDSITGRTKMTAGEASDKMTAVIASKKRR
jgi:ATP-dependent helicase IRC3